MIFKSNNKDMPEGTGKIATNMRQLRKLLRRLTPTGAGVSHGPAGTSIVMRPGRRGGGQTGAASWL